MIPENQSSSQVLNESNSTNNLNPNIIKYSPDVLSLFHSMYIMVMCFGIFGNLLTCAVILLKKSMRRSIHFYTFNLAVCDLMILFVYVPTQMVYMQHQLNWTMGIVMCRIAYVILPVSLFSTVGTLLAITIDRARGLVQPFKWRADSTRYSKITISGVWLVSLLVNIPLFIIPKLTVSDGDLVCSENWPNLLSMLIYWNFMFVLSFVIPLLIIIIAHIVMIYVMLKETNSTHRKQNKRMIRMVVALVLVFSLCTGYQHVYFYLVAYFPKTLNLSNKTWGLIFASANFVVSLQAALNPVIYGTLRHDFNKAFHYMFLKLLVFLKLHKELPRDFFSSNSTISRKSLRDTFRRTTFKRLVKRELYFQDSPLASRLLEHSSDASATTKRQNTRCTLNNCTSKYITIPTISCRTDADYFQNEKKYECVSKKSSVSTLSDEQQQNHALNHKNTLEVESVDHIRNNSQLLCSTPTSVLLSSSEEVVNEFNYDLFHTSDTIFSKLISKYLDNSEETKV